MTDSRMRKGAMTDTLPTTVLALLRAADLMEHFASKAVFEDGYTERLLIENWPLMDALAQYREARAALTAPVVGSSEPCGWMGHCHYVRGHEGRHAAFPDNAPAPTSPPAEPCERCDGTGLFYLATKDQERMCWMCGGTGRAPTPAERPTEEFGNTLHPQAPTKLGTNSASHEAEG